MFFERFDRVRRARRIIPAGATEDGREHDLVCAHQQNEGRSDHGSTQPAQQLLYGLLHFGVQRREVAAVGRRKHPNHQIEGGLGVQLREHMQPYDLPKTAFHEIAFDSGVLVLGHHEANPRKRMKGSGGAHV